MTSPEQTLLPAIDRIRSVVGRPVVVALDGGSGAGKSTIAGRLMRLTAVARVPLDDFYQTQFPEAVLPHLTVAQRLNVVFDWHRVRTEALEPLRAGHPGRWHGFDFRRGLGERGTYELATQVTEVAPAPTILLDGAYSAAPPLRDLIDLAVLIDAPSEVRRLRTVARGDDVEFLAKWHEIWDQVEAYYFDQVCPSQSFDLTIRNDGAGLSGVDAGGPPSP